MWSQSWSEIFDILEPFPGKSAIDITPTLQEQVGIGYFIYGTINSNNSSDPT